MTADLLIYACDDSPTQLEYVRRALGHLGTVFAFERPGDLIDAVGQVTPSVIVLDVSLPDQNAFDIMRDAKLPRNVPVLLVSGSRGNLDMAKLQNKVWHHRPLGTLHKSEFGGLADAVTALCDIL